MFEHGSYAQAIEFRKLAGLIMCNLVVDFFGPIIAEHPGLEPEEFKDAEPHMPQTLPESTAQSILAAVDELDVRLRSLWPERAGSLAPEEAAHFKESAKTLVSSLALARGFVASARRA